MVVVAARSQKLPHSRAPGGPGLSVVPSRAASARSATSSCSRSPTGRHRPARSADPSSPNQRPSPRPSGSAKNLCRRSPSNLARSPRASPACPPMPEYSPHPLSREHALPLSAESTTEDPAPCRHRDPATAATKTRPRRNPRQLHPFHPPATNDTAPWLITTRRSRSLSPASWLPSGVVKANSAPGRDPRHV